MRYFILTLNRFHLFMDLRGIISQVGLNISRSPRYWLGKYLVLWDMPCGHGTSSSLFLPVFHYPLHTLHGDSSILITEYPTSFVRCSTFTDILPVMS